MQIEQTQHVPVMLEEVLQFLQPEPGGFYIDGTLGGGGHTAALLERSAPDGKVLGIDADREALMRVKKRLPEAVQSERLILAHGNFAEMTRLVQESGFSEQPIQGILLDLGFSSDQMDNPQRGFAFSADGPLDMRLDQELALSAADLVNTASEHELADIIWRYGEENRSRAIARRIVRERAQEPITTTARLARLAAAGVPYKSGGIHPATKTFQALRIAVNQELERLEATLPQMLKLLEEHPAPRKSGRGGSETREAAEEGIYAGRMAVIAFHSLEDRMVKEFVRQEARDCICPPRLPVCICGHKARLHQLTTRPVVPSEQEVKRNPRARSAKLRVAEAIIRPYPVTLSNI